jgi:TM2 domain-containing membrane protein YozV
VIPQPEGAPDLPPPPPPPSSTGTVEIAPCPSCAARLTVARTDLGSDVECPYCKAVYKAVVPGTAGVTKASVRGDSPKRRPADDDDDDRPSRRRRDDDEDDDDRPRRNRRKSRTRGIESKRTMAGILAILIGGFGVHKFYLGYTGAGVLQILLSCLGVGGIIALIEGIIYLTKSDEEFIETYQLGEKQWF